MKRIYFTLFLASLPLVTMAHPRDVIYKKTIEKDYQVNDKALLQLGNKYGKIVLHTWDKNEIKATILVSGYGEDQDEAEKMADMVDIDASQSANNGDVSISTSYEKQSHGFSSLWHLLFRGWFSSNGGNYATIDYDVYLPASLRMLDVRDNYGDVESDSIISPLDLALNYSNCDLVSVSGPLDLKMNYSKGMVTKAAAISLSSNYSTLETQDASSIDTHSNYSNYKLARVGSFSLESNYDDVAIDQLRDIEGHSSYTGYKIGELDGTADLHCHYGHFDVAKLGDGFTSLNFEASYCPVRLGMDPKSNFRIDAKLSYGDLKTGDFQFKDLDSDTRANHRSFSATTTGGSDSSPMISFDGSYSDLILKTQ